MADNPMELLGQLIKYAHDMGATDVHVSPGLVPDVVVRGQLFALDDAPQVTEEVLQAWAAATCGPSTALLAGPAGACDGVVTVGPVRVRCAFRRQRGGIALTARLLPVHPPQLGELQVPKAVADLITRPNGLVIVSGPTGAGKSTLLAAMVDEVNRHVSKHIMTIEEPVEYLHPQLCSRISQREVGLDVATFGDALRAALRARPDIVVVGEMRDGETARAAVEAATKGQLVLATSHAGSASDALEGLVGLFPAVEQSAAAGRLASVLQGVVIQRLLPNVDGTGMVAVREVLLRTDGIAAMVRKGDYTQLYNTLQENRDAPGMFRLEEDLRDKVRAGLITQQVAMLAANNRSELEALLRGTSR